MLNTLTIPSAVAEEIMSHIPGAWQTRVQALTAEEMFYAWQLLKFRAKDPPKALFYLALRVRLVRYLQGKERRLFDEGEWRALERLWKIQFLKFCLKERDEA